MYDFEEGLFLVSTCDNGLSIHFRKQTRRTYL